MTLRHLGALAAAAAIAIAPFALAPAAASAAPAPAAPASTATSAAAAATASAASWSVAPADETGPDGRISLRHELDAGATASDRIAVSNHGPEAVEYVVAAGDGMVGANGAFDIRQGEPERGGAWITVGGLDERGTVVVDPGTTVVLPLEIAVPGNATPGDHPAGVVVGLASTSAEGVQVQHRMGVRLHLQVAGELAPSLDAEVLGTGYDWSWNPFEPGTAEVRVAVENIGNVRVSPGVATTIGGPFGLLSERSGATDTAELLPGDRTVVTASVPAWPLVWLLGDVQATPVAVGEDSWTGAGATSLPVGLLAFSPAWLVVLAVVLASAVALVLRRRAVRIRRTRARLAAA